MKHTLKKLSDTRVSLFCTADEATINEAKALAVRELSKTVKVPGFRGGKVPGAVAEKHLDPNRLANEAVEYAINAVLSRAVEAEDLHVLDQPDVELKKFVPFTTLEFTAEFDILPEITLGDYKKLTAKIEVTNVEKTEVDQVLERMQLGFAEKSSVERAARDGDEVTIDFDGKDKDDQPIEGAKGADYSLRLGSQTFIPGFEEQIVGHKAGEQFAIDVTFPSDYQAEHLKGAKVTFYIALKKIQQVILPKVDDAFAKKSGPFDTAAELKADIKRELIAQKDRTASDKLKDELIAELVQASTVPLPEVLIDDQMKQLEQDMRQNLMYRGQTIEQYIESSGYKDEAEWRDKELRSAAERRVATGLVLSELSKVEKIEITADELESELVRRKEEMPKMADQLDTPEARRDLANRVITEKTLERLIALNT